MRSVLALVTLAASAAGQAVTGLIVPSAHPPAGCENSRSGTFTITIQNVTNAAPSASKRDLNIDFDLVRRQKSGVLTLTLDGGILTDQANRTGYIASNYQFQFDGPPQNGAIYTGGFSLCANGSLALGGNAIFWQCLSGTFYNLYDRNWANTCNAVYIQAIGGAGSVYSTSPPVPESTGASTATISNPGTMVGSGTAVGIGGGGNSTSTTMASSKTGTGPASRSASSTGAMSSGAASSSGSGSSGGSAAAATTSAAGSGNGAAVMDLEAPKTLLAWAAGIVGALVV